MRRAAPVSRNAARWRRRGIAVAQIHPGYVKTRMVNFGGLIDAEEADRLVTRLAPFIASAGDDPGFGLRFAFRIKAEMKRQANLCLLELEALQRRGLVRRAAARRKQGQQREENLHLGPAKKVVTQRAHEFTSTDVRAH